MQIFLQSCVIVYQFFLVFGESSNGTTKFRLRTGIPHQGRTPYPYYYSTSGYSNIKLLEAYPPNYDGESVSIRPQKRRQPRYKAPTQKKSGSMYSMIKGFFPFGSANANSFDQGPNTDYHNDNGERHPEASESGHGWGEPVKHIYTEVKGHSGSGFGLLEFMLGALSLVSLGAFLLNLLASLASLLGLGYFTTTMTYPTYTNTATMTMTDTGGTGTAMTGTMTGGTAPTVRAETFLSSIGSYFRSDWKKPGKRFKKKRKGNGNVQADPGFGGVKGSTDSIPNYNGETETLADDEEEEDTSADASPDFEDDGRILKRKTRSIWEPKIHPHTSLDIAARSVLNAIESVEAKFECMEKVACEGSRHARIVGQGLEYFTPISIFSLSYFGHKLGLHQKLPNHFDAILLGVQEANCNTNFPQCAHVTYEYS